MRIGGLSKFTPCTAISIPFEALESRTFLSTVPAGFADSRITSGIAQGTAMALLPDGRILVSEQGGKLRLIKSGKLQSSPFLTINTTTNASEGLIGVAVDPQFASNGYIYVSYSSASGGKHTNISRFTANGDSAAGSSEQVLFQTGTLQNHEHNGGALAFGPDGKLYIALGDDLTITNAQSKNSTQGKILRINKDGSIPTDNPFYGSTAGNNRAIWAYGFRNPYTFAFQPGTGRLLAGDVGSDFWEEVDEVTKGANYGWSDTEGPTTTPGQTTPLFAYQHKVFGECVIIGSFYNPTSASFPSSYVGKLFFADYARGFIKTLDVSKGTPTTGDFISGLDRCVSILTANDGSIYYLLRGGAAGTGEVHRVSYSLTSPPSISEQPQDQSVAIGLSATFEVSASGTTPLTYQWRRNGKNIDGATEATFTINTVSADDDGDRFDCIVTNPLGTKTSDPATLTALNDSPPVPTINLPDINEKYHAGEIITFSASATDAEDGDLPATAFSWTALLHHDQHTHPFYGPVDGIKGGSFEIPQVEETSAEVYYQLFLTVTDSAGVSTTIEQDIQPEKVQFIVQPNVAGLSVALDAVSHTDAPTVTGVAGIRRQLSAPLVQVLNGTVYQFSNWSDGGDATHFIFTPDIDTLYTANYTPIGTVPIGDGLAASYFNNADFTGTKKTRTDPQINFIWSLDPPITGFGSDSFSVRWTGYLVAPTSETYTFTSDADDGIKVWVNNKVLIDKFSSTGLKEYSGSIALTAGVKVPIKVEYKDISGFAKAQLSWASTKLARQVIPQSALFTSGAVPPVVTKTLIALADTFVQGGSLAGQIFGDDAELRVKTASVDPSNIRETYLQFDLTGLTSINSAKLSLTGKLNKSGSVPVGIYTAPNAPAWNEATLTWNTKFATSLSPIGTVTVNSTTDKAFTVDITTQLKNELAAGHTLVTLVLKSTVGTTPYAIFHSRESSSGKPQVVIT